jgi:hypothetical protein
MGLKAIIKPNRKVVTMAFAWMMILFASLEVKAAVLWAGGEDSELTFSNASLDQTAGHFRSGYARGDIQVVNNSSGYVRTGPVVSASSLWFHTMVYVSSSTGCCNSGNSNDVIRLVDASNIPRIVFHVTIPTYGDPTTPSNWSVQTVNAAGTHTTIGATFSTGFTLGGLSKLDVQVTNYGTSGTLNIYINGGLTYSYTGNIATDSNTALNGIDLGGISYAGNATFGYSETIIATTDTRSMGLITLTPSGNGTDQGWTCSGATNYGSVNAWSNSDTYNCSSSSATQAQGFTLSSLPTGGFGISAVVTSVRASAGASGPQHLQHLMTIGGVDYLSPTSPGQSLSTSYQNYQNVWTLNPATGSAWSTSDVGAGLNSGFESQN